MKVELVDVTKCARNHKLKTSGWRIAVSRRAWELCMAIPTTEEKDSEEFRLSVMLTCICSALKQPPSGGCGYLAGFSFVLNGAPEYRRLVPVPFEPSAVIRIGVFPAIDPNGSPSVIVLSPEESPITLGEPRAENGSGTNHVVKESRSVQ